MKKQKKNQLAVTKKNVPKMLEVVDSKIKELEMLGASDVSTDGCLLSITGRYSIKDMDNECALIRAYSSVMHDELMYKKAFKEMGIEGDIPDLVLCGFSIDQWKNDILSRYHELSVDKQLVKLYKAKLELEKNLSEEDRLKKSMERIQDILTDK